MYDGIEDVLYVQRLCILLIYLFMIDLSIVSLGRDG